MPRMAPSSPRVPTPTPCVHLPVQRGAWLRGLVGVQHHPRAYPMHCPADPHALSRDSTREVTVSGQWKDSTRRSELPRDWKQRAARVRKRDGFQCTESDENGRRCAQPGRDVDHIVPGQDHSYSNLRTLCVDCHKAKTQREAAEGRAKARGRARYGVESHPGVHKK